MALQFKDLFPARPGEHGRAQRGTQIPVMDVLITLDHEAQVVGIVATDLIEHQEIDSPTWQRLAVAVDRIGYARSQIAPLMARVRA